MSSEIKETANICRNKIKCILSEAKHELFPDSFHDKPEGEDNQDSSSGSKPNEDDINVDEDQQKACIKYNSTASNRKTNVVFFIS
ncbi:unnamed protein product [Rotaria sp. Silwood1]|nr:unnamed protein product [Rotaria sp. Silwood1]CAF1253745.1 unnamed protein product [Rotaria sp. Silwood1]CAF3499458.1 unnamed protein product [Rotaria sp. Silwood1]CAF3505690.1 unnamed protein product [Rotaria sp. Silwood1]CAF3508021.1 unnamed protein product [Rotaria sp. Silwood1]